MLLGDGCGRPPRRDNEPVPDDAIIFQPITVDALNWYTNTITAIGRTVSGKKVIAHLVDFHQYFYVNAEPFTKTGVTDGDQLFKLIQKKNPNAYRIIIEIKKCQKKSVYEFKPQTMCVYKITVQKPCDMFSATTLLEEIYKELRDNHVPLGGWSMSSKLDTTFPKLEFFDVDDLPSYLLKFFANTGFKAMLWCVLTVYNVTKVFGVKATENYYNDNLVSNGDIILGNGVEVELSFRNAITVSQDYSPLKESTFEHLKPKLIGGWGSIAPFHMLAFDIECVNLFRPKQFPDRVSHPISQISLLMRVANDTKTEARRIVLTTHKPSLSEVLNEDGKYFTIRSYALESQMLNAFAQFFESYDPDIVSGYNIDQFDLHYLQGRASITGACKIFECLTRFKKHAFYVDNRRQRAEVEQSWAKKKRAAALKKHNGKSRIKGACSIAKYLSTPLLSDGGYGDYDINSDSNHTSGDNSSSAYAKNNKVPHLCGRTVIDTCKEVREAGHKFVSYKLNDVSQELMGQKKKDMPYHKIGPAHYGTPESVTQLCTYCMQDTNLAVAIFDLTQMFTDQVEKSRVFGLPIKTVITHGQQIRGIAMYADYIQQEMNGIFIFPRNIPECADPQFYSKLKQETFNLPEPTLRKTTSNTKPPNHVLTKNLRKMLDDPYLPQLGCRDEEVLAFFADKLHKTDMKIIKGYAGALVMEPVIGFYHGDDRVILSDFASLYPREIMSNNACTSTLTSIKAMHQYMFPRIPKINEDYIVSPDVGTVFVSAKHHEGLIPRVAKRLLKTRKGVKGQIKELDADNKPENKPLSILLDLRQKNVKIATNSLYGITGAGTSKMRAKSVASAITAAGRDTIKVTKLVIETCIEGAQVIYGDTDSTFTLLRKTCFEKCKEIGSYINKLINREISTGCWALDRLIEIKIAQPNCLEFEGIAENLLIYKKKKYVCRMNELNKGSRPKLYAKGIEIVRRDVPLLIKKVLQESLEHLLMNEDKAAGIECVRDMVAALHADNGSGNIIPLNLYSITKTIKCEEYEGNPAHAVLRRRLLEQKPSLAPEVGDKIQYIICKTGAKKNGEKARLVDEMRMDAQTPGTLVPPIDTEYYLNSLKDAITRVWELVLGSVDNVDRIMFKHSGLKLIGNGSMLNAFNTLFSLKNNTKDRCPNISDEVDGETFEICADLVPYMMMKRNQGHSHNQFKRKQPSDNCTIAKKRKTLQTNLYDMNFFDRQ